MILNDRSGGFYVIFHQTASIKLQQSTLGKRNGCASPNNEMIEQRNIN